MPSLLTKKLAPGGNKPYIYTICDNSANPFTLQLNKKEKKNIKKTAIVAFNNKSESITMAYLLESHKRIRKEWPKNMFDTDEDEEFSLYSDIRNINYSEALSELYINIWEKEELEEYCVRNIMDILYIEELQDSKHNFSLSGKLHIIEADYKYYINLFNDRINDL